MTRTVTVPVAMSHSDSDLNISVKPTYPQYLEIMIDRLLQPLQVNPRTHEPFLQLPSPFECIIITPPRDADKASVAEILSDPRVNLCLQVIYLSRFSTYTL